MAVSRRKFLKAGTLVILSAGVPLNVVAASSANSLGSFFHGNPLEKAGLLTHSLFNAQLNTKFRVATGEGRALNLELVEVKDLRTAAVKQSAAMAGRECFSTIFKGSAQTPLNQDTYTFEHQALGKFHMLLVPVGQSQQGLFYEAIFNRLY